MLVIADGMVPAGPEGPTQVGPRSCTSWLFPRGIALSYFPDTVNRTEVMMAKLVGHREPLGSGRLFGVDFDQVSRAPSYSACGSP